MTSYFDAYSPSITEYEYEKIPKIHLIAKEPSRNPSTNEWSERETCTLNHQGQISIPATVAKGPVFISAIISYSLAYNAADVIDNDNLAAALSAQIQINIALVGINRAYTLS